MKMDKRLSLLLLIALLILAIILLPKAWATLNPEQPARYSLHVVRASDTLWQISKRYMPKIDPRNGIYLIMRDNKLRSAMIYPGQSLRVPTTLEIELGEEN